MEREERIKFVEDNRDLINEFRIKVDAVASLVDPEDTADWHSLTLGWALGRGMEIAEAQKFADFIRYFTDLG